MIKILDIENNASTSSCFVDLAEQGLRVTLNIKAKSGYYKIYTCLIASLEAQPRLSGWFQNINELAQYIRQQDRLQIDEEKKILKILMKVNLNKNKIVTLAEIELNEIKKDYSQEIAEIMSRCNNEDELCQNQVKIMFKRFSQIIQELVISKLEPQKSQNRIDKISEQQSKRWSEKQLSQKLQSIWKEKSTEMQLEFNKKYCELRMEIQTHKRSLQRFIQQKISEAETNQFFSNSHLYKNINHSVLLNQGFNKITHNPINQQIPSKPHKSQQATLRNPTDVCLRVGGQKSTKKQQTFRRKPTENTQKDKQSNEVSFKSSNFTQRKTDKIFSAEWVDPFCYCYKNLQLKSNKITSKDPSNIFGMSKIRGQFSLSFNLEKIQRGVALGLIDSSYKTKTSLDNEPNWVVYWSDGECWDGSRQKNYGRGYQQGQMVSLVGDLTQGTIEWKVNTDIRCKIKCQRLKDKHIKWVPYICLWDKGDRVMIA